MSRGKILLVGWFSFPEMGATAGDLMVRDLVARWLRDAGFRVDLGVAEPFTGGVAWDAVDPNKYSDLVFVCGPFGNGWPITDLLERFPHCRLHGLDLSLLQSLDEWNPFMFVAPRDSSRESNPDLAFAATVRTVPIVGVIKVHPQSEYGERGMHDRAHELIDELLTAREVARVQIDTRLDANASGLRSAPEIVSLIGRMDVVVTTRLHGAVLAISQGVPALALDPIAGGAKVNAQMSTIGWSAVELADTATPDALSRHFDFCLTSDARTQARECGSRARERIADIRRSFLDSLGSPSAGADPSQTQDAHGD